MLIGDILVSNAYRYPSRLALVFGHKRFTWQELNSEVNRLCRGFLSIGLKKGDRIGFIAENSDDYAKVLFAASKLGLITVCLNYRFAPQQLCRMMTVTEAKALIVDSKFKDIVSQMQCDLPYVEKYIGMGPNHGYDHDFESLFASKDDSEPPCEVVESDPYAICFSSGTTGEPKAAVISHKNRITNCTQICLARKATRDSSILLAMAMYTVGLQQYLFAYAFVAAKLVIINFTPEDYLSAIEQQKPDSIMINYTLFSLIKEYMAKSDKKYDLSSIRVAQSAGQSLSYEQWQEVLNFMGNPMLIKGLAMTEAGVLTLGVPEDLTRWAGAGATEDEKRRFNSLGKPLMGVTLKVLDENGVETPPGEVGELVFKGDNIVKGYWNAAGNIRDGWLHTGDIGYVDEDGFMYLVGRKDDRIRTGGYNVYPVEIEAVLNKLPGVHESAVFAVQDELWGEMIVAAIICEPGSSLAADELKEQSKKSLASFQVPKKFHFVSEFPRHPVWNRVLKRELAAKLASA